MSEGDTTCDANGNDTVYTQHHDHTSGANLFRSMSRFFKDNFLAPGPECSMLVSVLEDLQLRKGYTFPALLSQLKSYCAKYESSVSRSYIIAMLQLNRKQGDSDGRGVNIFEVEYMRDLILLLCDETGNFSDIFDSVYSHGPSANCVEEDQQKLRDDLCYYLHHCSYWMFPIPSLLSPERGREGKTHQMRFIDYPLNYGESPLMSASRHRNPDVILTLLRHGARIQSEWMCYQSALEVLLLAPSLIYLEPDELRSIEIASQYYVRACISIDKEHIEYLIKGGYVPLHGDWRQLIPADRFSEPASLKQHCRVMLRAHLSRKRALPDGIARLPLPPILQRHLDLDTD